MVAALRKFLSDASAARAEPPVPMGHTIEVPFDDPAEEMAAPAVEPGPAEGQSFIIEYVDSKRRQSTRRVTVWGVKAGQDGIPLLVTKCHERQATRSFRVDRIRAVIDYDGVIHDSVDDFLEEVLGIPPHARVRPSRGPTARRMQEIADLVNSPALLLSALARADGHMDLGEIGIILDYCAALCDACGLDVTLEEVEELRQSFKRLRPSEDMVVRALAAIEHYPPEKMMRFLVACKALITVDGIEHREELALFDDICIELTGVPAT